MMKVLELFAGIGGFSCVLGSASTSVAAALDIDRNAAAAYRANFSHPCHTIEIATADLQPFANCFWWMSPPCLPYTQRGKQRDWKDPRSAALRHLISQIRDLRPPMIGLENVPPFADSVTMERLSGVLSKSGYHFMTRIACPTELGIPMRRRRFYLLAARQDVTLTPPFQHSLKNFQIPWTTTPRLQLKHYLVREGTDPDCRQSTSGFDPSALLLDQQLFDKYQAALHIVECDDPLAICACFAGSYGKAIVRSGSYLRVDQQLRRLHPREIARLLGFPNSFKLPSQLRTAYRLLGNSLSLDVVRKLFVQPDFLPSIERDPRSR